MFSSFLYHLISFWLYASLYCWSHTHYRLADGTFGETRDPTQYILILGFIPDSINYFSLRIVCSSFPNLNYFTDKMPAKFGWGLRIYSVWKAKITTLVSFCLIDLLTGRSERQPPVSKNSVSNANKWLQSQQNGCLWNVTLLPGSTWQMDHHSYVQESRSWPNWQKTYQKSVKLFLKL